MSCLHPSLSFPLPTFEVSPLQLPYLPIQTRARARTQAHFPVIFVHCWNVHGTRLKLQSVCHEVFVCKQSIIFYCLFIKLKEERIGDRRVKVRVPFGAFLSARKSFLRDITRALSVPLSVLHHFCGQLLHFCACVCEWCMLYQSWPLLAVAPCVCVSHTLRLLSCYSTEAESCWQTPGAKKRGGARLCVYKGAAGPGGMMRKE